jgi:hypothetical protein
MAETVKPQDITLFESSDYYTGGWCVLRGKTVLAECMAEQDAKEYAALLRVQNAMTPDVLDMMAGRMETMSLAMEGSQAWRDAIDAFRALSAELTKEKQ